MNITVSVKGDKELARKLNSGLYAPQLSRFFRRAGHTIMGLVMDKVPRWDGNLANSLQVESDTAVPMRFVRVGTNAEYAEAVEKGSRPHWPPLEAITPWANDHGIDPFLVQRTIGTRGTKPRPFLEPALEDAIPQIEGFLRVMASEIEAAAGGL